MLVTGAQPVGAKGVSAVQGTVVDLKEAVRLGVDADHDRERTESGARARDGEPQPVVFPRAGASIDQRPVALRQAQAAARYRSDGDPADTDDAA